jgi:hypothetical protein
MGKKIVKKLNKKPIVIKKKSKKPVTGGNVIQNTHVHIDNTKPTRRTSSKNKVAKPAIQYLLPNSITTTQPHYNTPHYLDDKIDNKLTKLLMIKNDNIDDTKAINYLTDKGNLILNKDYNDQYLDAQSNYPKDLFLNNKTPFKTPSIADNDIKSISINKAYDDNISEMSEPKTKPKKLEDLRK